MSRALTEQSNKISIFNLKKWGCLIPKQFGGGLRAGTLSWTWGSGTREDCVEYFIGTDLQEMAGMDDFMKLRYTITDRRTGEQEDFNYQIDLATTPCNYGGVRYWFICLFCGRRVGVIYRSGKRFGCRRCGNLAYTSQNYGGNYKGFVSEPEVMRVEEEVKRKYYMGRLTRKYLRYIKLNSKFERSLNAVVERLNNYNLARR